MKYTLFIFLLITALASTSCVNLKPRPDSTKLYTLGPVPALANAVSAEKSKAVYVARPNLPLFLNGNQLKYRLSDGELKRLSAARWAEALDEGIARAMAEFLSASSPTVSVSGYYPWPYLSADLPKLNLHFHQFAAHDDGSVHLEVDWQLRRTGGASVSGRFTATSLRWSKNKASSLVSALNEGLKQLSDEIAGSL
ncbi:MAG: PqiC family protein [Opitutales bacterium]